MRLEDFDIELIANSLARQGRYLGNGNHYLSVAEHCVFLSYVVPEEHAFAALMHDATEAFVGDLHTKIKRMMYANQDYTFQRLEMWFWELLATKYQLPYHVPEEVHRLDVKVRELEYASLFGKRQFFCAWNPEEAASQFLSRAHQLAPEVMDR